MKYLLFILLTVLMGCGSAPAAVLVFSDNGAYSGAFTNLSTAKAAPGVKRVVVTTPQTLTNNIAWPADRELKFEKGGYVVSGVYSLTGLKEARPDYFGNNATPGTTNMTTAVKAAMVAAASGIVDASGGTYLVDKVTYTGNLDLRGGTFISNTVGDHVFNLSGANVTIDGVTITSGFSGTGDIPYAAFQGIRIVSTSPTPSYVAGSVAIVRNSRIHDYRNTGVLIDGYDTVEVRDNKISNLGAEGIQTAGKNIKITGNQIYKVCGGAIQTSSGQTLIPYWHGPIISGNQIDLVYPANATALANSGDHGIAIEVNSVFNSAVVSNNTIQRAHSMGISLSSSSSSSITGNTIYRTGLTDHSTGFSYRSFASIEVVNADWCTITGNELSDHWSRGLVIDKSHNVNVTGNVFRWAQQSERYTLNLYHITIYGSGATLSNASWGVKINSNTFINAGLIEEGPTAVEDLAAYAVYVAASSYGHYPTAPHEFTNNTVQDCIVSLSGQWKLDGNVIQSSGVLDVSTSTAWALPLLDLVNVTSPIRLERTYLLNSSATSSVGFVRANSTSSELNQTEIHGCRIKNATNIVYAAGGFIGRLQVTNTHLDTVQNAVNRGKNGTDYYLMSSNNTGDRLVDLPITVWAAAAPVSNTWVAGDIIYKINPSGSTSNGWMVSVSGTMGTLNAGATTGGISSGSAVLTVSSATGLATGAYITIAGVTGVKKIVSISGTTVTLNSNADATVSGAAVAFSAATFKTLAAVGA